MLLSPCHPSVESKILVLPSVNFRLPDFHCRVLKVIQPLVKSVPWSNPQLYGIILQLCTGLPTEIHNLLFNDLKHFQKHGRVIGPDITASSFENLPLHVQEQ